jgi:hypothetical protein
MAKRDDRMINRLFEDQNDRAMVRSIVDALPQSMHEDRVTALLHELARPVPDGQTPQQSADYITDFVAVIGAMPHERQAFVNWIDTADAVAFTDAVEPESGDAPPDVIGTEV